MTDPIEKEAQTGDTPVRLPLTGAAAPGHLAELRQITPTAQDAPEMNGLDLVSFALSPGQNRMSMRDLNRIGLALVQEAVKSGDLGASANVFGSLVKVNTAKQGDGGRKQMPAADMRRALERAHRAKQTRTTIDVIPDEPAGLGPE